MSALTREDVSALTQEDVTLALTNCVDVLTSPPPLLPPLRRLQVDVSALTQEDVTLALTNCVDVLIPAITEAGIDIASLADLATCPTTLSCTNLPGAVGPAPAPETETVV